jgi:DNA processing protein
MAGFLAPGSVVGVARPGDEDWPAGLRDLTNPPVALRVAGVRSELRGAVAVVGTRRADPDALAFTQRLAAELARAGRTVISGGAIGIDAAAHRGALSVGGSTLCVLATGFDRAYPRQHAELFRDIALRGWLVTEQPDGAGPTRVALLSRNRLVAAMAEAVVVVQAPLRSGALSTAAFARRLKRPVFAVPYAPWDGLGEGCTELLRRGARICTSVRDVLSVPPHAGGEEPVAGSDSAENIIHVDELDEDGRAVLERLGRRPLHPDELCSSLGLPITRVQPALLSLLLLGLVEEREGRYQRSSGRNSR